MMAEGGWRGVLPVVRGGSERRTSAWHWRTDHRNMRGTVRKLTPAMTRSGSCKQHDTTSVQRP